MGPHTLQQAPHEACLPLGKPGYLDKEDMGQEAPAEMTTTDVANHFCSLIFKLKWVLDDTK